jgi:hypothetical protein
MVRRIALLRTGSIKGPRPLHFGFGGYAVAHAI